MSLPSPPKIAILLLNYNGKRDSIACLESLSKINYPNFEILFIDNGSADGSLQAIRELFPQVKCLEIKVNVGFAGGNNVGIEHALQSDAELFLLLNNDTVVDPDMLNAFAQGFADHPESGILGARIYLFEKRDTLDHLGGMWQKKKADMQLIGLREKDPEIIPAECAPLDYVCGACMIIRRKVFEKIGLLEPRYFLYWEENDFCLRAQRAGFLTMTCPKAKIWHKVSASIVGGRPQSTYFWWRGRLLWISRHYNFIEKTLIYFRILIPAFYKLGKIKVLKSLQLRLLRRIRPSEDQTQRENKLRNNRAALAGIRDYYLKQFGRGPDWIYKK